MRYFKLIGTTYSVCDLSTHTHRPIFHKSVLGYLLDVIKINTSKCVETKYNEQLFKYSQTESIRIWNVYWCEMLIMLLFSKTITTNRPPMCPTNFVE